MATTAADARAIVAAAAKAGKQVLIPCGYNFTDYTATAARVVEEGRIGEVKHIVCQMSSALEDFFAGQPMLETAEHMYRPPASTWADPKKAGGYGWGPALASACLGFPRRRRQAAKRFLHDRQVTGRRGLL